MIPPRALLAASLWLAASPVLSAEPTGRVQDAFRFADTFFSRFHLVRPEPCTPITCAAAPAVVARLDPKADMDRYLRTRTSFRTPGGRLIHVAANRTVDCPDGGTDCMGFRKYYILFLAEDGELFGASAFQIANYSVLKKGGKDIPFDPGRTLTVRLFVAGLSVEGAKDSTLEVSARGKLIYKVRIKDVIAAMSEAAVPVPLSRPYEAYLGRDLHQNAAGDCWFGSDSTLALIPKGTDKEEDAYSIPVRSISSEGAVLPVDGAYGLRLAPGNAVEIFKRS
ncbi:MAG: hypothetical protein PHU21_01115 [Elusimicrobia bacterium]|nr:hypothetical protein [Elusimicrobiota bacterium]